MQAGLTSHHRGPEWTKVCICQHARVLLVIIKRMAWPDICHRGRRDTNASYQEYRGYYYRLKLAQPPNPFSPCNHLRRASFGERSRQVFGGWKRRLLSTFHFLLLFETRGFLPPFLLLFRSLPVRDVESSPGNRLGILGIKAPTTKIDSTLVYCKTNSQRETEKCGWPKGEGQMAVSANSPRLRATMSLLTCDMKRCVCAREMT